MDTKEIRRLISEVLGIDPEYIGALRGDNMTIITVAEVHAVLLTEHNRGRVLDKLAETFGPSYIHLGYIRFV